jgi:hypothetical protein
VREDIVRAGPGAPPVCVIPGFLQDDRRSRRGRTVVPVERADAGRPAGRRPLRAWSGLATAGALIELPTAGARPAPLPDLDRALVNPAGVFGSPDEVVRHPLLTVDCKREILTRWAWDEYLLELATAEGMPEGEASRLQEVRAALRLVSDERGPGPAAPAAFVWRYDIQDVLAA